MPLFTIRTRDKEHKFNIGGEKKSSTNETRTLPYWLQLVVAFASIISSLGIAVAILQLGVSSEQFQISNKGQLIFRAKFTPILYSGEDTRYQSYMSDLKISAELENVGHAPISFKMTDLEIHKNKVIYAGLADTLQTEMKLYPTENLDFNIATIPFSEDNAFFYPEKINEMDIHGHYTVEYWDVNRPEKKSTYKRSFKVSYNKKTKDMFAAYTKFEDEYVQ